MRKMKSCLKIEYLQAAQGFVQLSGSGLIPRPLSAEPGSSREKSAQSQRAALDIVLMPLPLSSFMLGLAPLWFQADSPAAPRLCTDTLTLWPRAGSSTAPWLPAEPRIDKGSSVQSPRSTACRLGETGVW